MNETNGSSTLAELLKTVSEDTRGEPQIDATAPVLTENDEVLELGEDFDFDGFQVVRREFFAHLREPSVTFNNCKFSVNTACLTRFTDFDYAQVLVNRERKILALRPCAEEAKDSFMWCSTQGGKRKPKPITCKLFFAKVMTLMEWNPDHRYKLLGKVIHANGEYMLAFDLTATEVYQRTIVEGQKPKTSRKPMYPAEWQDQFGMPYNEHKQSMQINIFDGYAVLSVKANEDSNNGAVSTTHPVPVGTESELGGNS